MNALERAIRRDLLALLATAPEWEAERAHMLARWLDGLAPGSAVAFYGCGGLARHLAEGHRDSLLRHDARFFTTKPDGDTLFCGFPKTSLDQVRGNPPERVALLSAAFEWEMLQALEGLPCKEMLTLRALVESSAGEALLARVHGEIRAEAAELARTLGPKPAGRPRLGIAYNSIGLNVLESFREFQACGFFVALLATDSPAAREARERGWVDALHTVPTSEHLNILLHALLVEHHALEAVLTWTSLWNPPYLEDIAARSSAKTAFWCDAFVDLFFDHGPSGAIIEAELATTKAAFLDQSRRIYCGADVLFIKDGPGVQGLVEERLGCRPNTVSAYPYLSLELFDTPRPARPIRQAGPEGPLRLVLAQSIHRTRLASVWFELEHLFSLAQVLTAQGLDVTFYNASDPTGLGCDDFLALAEANPLFHYRSRVSPATLAEELRGFDLGLLEYSPGPIKKMPAYFATNMQLKLFAYVQAGLPVLAVPELAFCHELVTSRGLGLSIALEHMDTLAERLRDFDFAACRANLREFCAEMEVGRQVRAQADALLPLLGKPAVRAGNGLGLGPEYA